MAAGLAASSAACRRSRSPWRFFTPGEARTVSAICGRIIPDDRDPGAVQAGVVNYIDTQLAGFYRPLQKTYREALAALNGFADLPPEAQTQRLQQIEKDPQLKPFFDLVVAHTMQGFYGDPRHGGNRDRVSWRMLGLPYPQIRGRLRYDIKDPAKGEKPWL